MWVYPINEKKFNLPGRRTRQALLRLGLSQEDLAVKLNCRGFRRARWP